MIETMRPLLQRPRSEFLINFAYNFINRTASMAIWQDAMTKLLGSTVKLDGLQPAHREEALVNAYRAGLKACVPAGRSEYRARSAYVTVLAPLHRRTKYHLVYLTCHSTGIVEFMEISERVDLVQRQVRAAKQIDARQQKTGVTDMFSADPQAEPADGRSSSEDVEAFWRNYLAVGERRVRTADFADILETTNWLPGELQSSLVRLVKAGAVRNLDADATRRRTRPLHFEKSERLVVGTARERLAPVHLPVSELVADGKPLAATHARRSNRRDRAVAHAHQHGLAPLKDLVLDQHPRVIGYGVDIDVARIADTEPAGPQQHQK